MARLLETLNWASAMQLSALAIVICVVAPMRCQAAKAELGALRYMCVSICVEENTYKRDHIILI